MNKILYGEILTPGGEEEQADQEKEIQAGFWQTVKKAAGRIPFIEDVAASYYCMLDPATPTRVRGILLAALAYFVLPLDIVPDFIAGFGFTDDIAVLGAAIAAIRSSLKQRHYIAAKNTLKTND
jgi:uncharacterized membrane protein YkvA (DUF1232 family)